MGAPENRPNYAAGPNWPAGARLPIPGNAEWFWWMATVVVVLIAVPSSRWVNIHDWVDFLKWTTSAYLISRGIAKASRVLEQ